MTEKEKKTYVLIGSYEEGTDGKPMISRDWYRQGWVLKDEAAYHSGNGVCYVPELSDTAYTRQDFLDMCNGQPEIADRVFEAVDWQHPGSWLEEQWMYDEPELAECACGKWYWCYGVDKCPHCGAPKAEAE